LLGRVDVGFCARYADVVVENSPYNLRIDAAAIVGDGDAASSMLMLSLGAMPWASALSMPLSARLLEHHERPVLGGVPDDSSQRLDRAEVGETGNYEGFALKPRAVDGLANPRNILYRPMLPFRRVGQRKCLILLWGALSAGIANSFRRHK